jgi:hypothetical protein
MSLFPLFLLLLQLWMKQQIVELEREHPWVVCTQQKVITLIDVPYWWNGKASSLLNKIRLPGCCQQCVCKSTIYTEIYNKVYSAVNNLVLCVRGSKIDI